MRKKDEAPVLTEVVKRGDEDLIKAARLEREIIDELNRMAPRDRPARKPEESTIAPPSADTDGVHLEEAIDRIVQRHSAAMRKELQQLLKNRLGQ